MFKSRFYVCLSLICWMGLPVKAFAEPAAWTLSLAWSPQYCKSQGKPDEPQCENSALLVPWALAPQQAGAAGCAQRTPLTDTQVDRLMSLTQNARQSRDLWRQVGGCVGLSFDEFATQFDYASRRVGIPQAYSELSKRRVLPAAELRQQFLDANPDLTEQGMALHCKGSELVAIDFCLTQKMKFTDCGAQTIDDCGSRKIQLRAPER